MAVFDYVVKDKAGKTHRGTLQIQSRSALIEQLWKREFVVLSINERPQGQSALVRVASGRVKSEHLVIFSRQLATMVDSGISIAVALDVLSEQIEDRSFKHILKKIRSDIEAGSSLSEAAARHPKAFSDFFVNMMRAGETSGQLDDILDRVAGYLEKASILQRKVKASLFYPAFVTMLAIGITTFLIVVIVPKFKDIFTALGGQLPTPTKILLQISEFTGKYFLFEIGVIVGGWVLLQVWINTPQGRLWYDRTSLHVPLIGKLLRKVVIAQFARTLGTLIKSGVPILTSLEIVAKTSGNKVVEQAIMSARASIKEGENISDPLALSKVFPAMVTRMISVGEKTGELEKMLTKIAEFYENEVDAAVTALTSLIEPLIIAILGFVIGGIVIALFLPVFKISTLVK